MSNFRFMVAFVHLSLVICHSAWAHPADQSEMRVRPEPHKLDIRLTFNILTLTRFVAIDADGDMKISMAELAAAEPKITAYLNAHMPIEINQVKAALGMQARFEPLWPNAVATPPMTEFEYAARNVDVTFTPDLAGKLLEDFWLGFEIFEQTGPMQTIRGIYEQDGQILEVPFSVQEPDYLYDTGFADDPFVQTAEKQPQQSPEPSSMASTPNVAIAALLAVVLLAWWWRKRGLRVRGKR